MRCSRALAAVLPDEEVADVEHGHAGQRAAQERHHLAEVDEQRLARDDQPRELEEPSGVVPVPDHAPTPFRLSSAWRAAACCASFFVRPEACATTRSRIRTSTTKIFLWSGPTSSMTRYTGSA